MAIQSTHLYKRHRKKVRRLPLEIIYSYCKNLISLIILALIALVIFPTDLINVTNDLHSKIVERLNFKVDEISIVGADKLDIDELKKISGISLGTNLLKLNIDLVKTNIENQSWVKNAIVERVLPNSVVISIIKETPSAIFNDGLNSYLVNKNGKTIEKTDSKVNYNLIVVTGSDANSQFGNILDQLHEFQSIYTQIESLNFKNKRRWDVKLKNNFILELPENNIYQALEAFEQNFDMSLKLYKICVVDLRLIPDKIYLKIM